MAYQTGRPVKVPAEGDAPNTGSPGPTPPPTLAETQHMKDTAYGRTSYGANAYAGRVVANPGKSVTSPLADQLKAKAAEGDGGDLLQTIIEKGTAARLDGRSSLAANPLCEQRTVPGNFRAQVTHGRRGKPRRHGAFALRRPGH